MPEEVREERRARFMETQARISATKLQARVGRTLTVLIDEAGDDGAIGRSAADAPEIDGVVHLPGAAGLHPGDLVQARIVAADDYDLEGTC